MSQIEIIDQIGRKIQLNTTICKIVSLVPSITELLIDLGLEKQLVGRTKFCIYPKSISSKVPIIGGTKTVDIEKIKNLSPDLIIANKEENTLKIVEILEVNHPVYVSNVQSIHSALDMILDIGSMTNRKAEANNLVTKIEESRINWHKIQAPPKSCIYLIWKKPWMTIGRDTFIHVMLQEMGFQSVVYDFRYPQLTDEEMERSDAKYILLSSEPYPFKEQEMNLLQQKNPNKKVILVDGSYFSWYGSRILEAYNYFNTLNVQIKQTESEIKT